MNAQLTVKQAAELANRNRKTISRACASGDLPHDRVWLCPNSRRGFRYLIREEDLVDWLSRRCCGPKTEDRDDRIARLTRAGYTAPEIAAIVGVTERTVQRARVRSGVARPFCGNPLTTDEIRRAADMLDDGASYGEVGRTIGRSPRTILARFPGRSTWKPGSGIEYARYRAALDAIVPPLNCQVAS